MAINSFQRVDGGASLGAKEPCGSYDYDRARALAEAQPQMALSSVACMDDARLAEFVALYNRVFGPMGRTMRIIDCEASHD